MKKHQVYVVIANTQNAITTRKVINRTPLPLVRLREKCTKFKKNDHDSEISWNVSHG